MGEHIKISKSEGDKLLQINFLRKKQRQTLLSFKKKLSSFLIYLVHKNYLNNPRFDKITEFYFF